LSNTLHIFGESVFILNKVPAEKSIFELNCAEATPAHVWEAFAFAHCPTLVLVSIPVFEGLATFKNALPPKPVKLRSLASKSTKV
jgi:hypothetical protein